MGHHGDLLDDASLRSVCTDNTRVCWETAASARRHPFFDPQIISKDIGWRAQAPIEDIIRDAVRWFQGLEQGEVASQRNLLKNANVAAS